MSDPPTSSSTPSKKGLRDAKKAARRRPAQTPQNDPGSDPPDQQVSTTGQSPIATEPHSGNPDVSLPTCLDSGLQNLKFDDPDATRNQNKHGLVDNNPPKPFPQDPNNITRSTLLANYFSVGAGKYRTLFKYALDFHRKETEEDRKKREEKEKKEEEKAKNGGEASPKAEVVQDGDNTYLKVQPARAKRRRLVRILVKELQSPTPNSEIPLATDYFEQIITAEKLRRTADDHEVNSNEWKEDVYYFDEYQNTPPANCEVFRVTITGPEELNLDRLRDFLSTEENNITSYAKKDDTIRALNIIFSYGPYEACFRKAQSPEQEREPTLTTKNGTKFHGIAGAVIPSNPEGQVLGTRTGKATYMEPGTVSITGFARSIRTSSTPKGLIALNVNTATSVFYQRVGTLQELIDNWRVSRKEDLPKDGDEYYRALDMFLKNVRVRTAFPTPQENYIGRVTGIAKPRKAVETPTPANCKMRSPHLTQDDHSTVAEHFEKKLGTPNSLRNSNDLVVTLGEGDYLETVPANYLDVILGQLNRNTDTLPVAGILTPQENKDLVLEARNVVLETSANTLGARQFQLTLAPDLLRVSSDKLQPPDLEYGTFTGSEAQKTEFRTQLRYGSWNLRNWTFVVPAQPCKWTYVELRLASSRGCFPAKLREFQSQFQTAFTNVGMAGFQFVTLEHEEHHVELSSGVLPGRDNLDGLKSQDKKISEALQFWRNHVDFVVVLLPSRNQDLYGSVKRAGDQAVGITTICHVTEPDPKTKLPFLANLTMKINLKAYNHAVNQVLRKQGPILTDKSMVIGIDVTHPGSTAMLDSPSIAAVVGSIDSQFAQWPASLAMQMPPKDPKDALKKKQSIERVLELRRLVYERIEHYYKRKGNMPDKIVVYRDGLSEEQFDMCVKKELPEIKAAIKTARNGKRGQIGPGPKVMLICAVKRHNTRCFPALGAKDEAEAVKDNMFICKGPPTKSNTETGKGTNKGFERDTGKGAGKEVGEAAGKGAVKEKEEEFNWNPMPGTWIKERITYGDNKDFFLYSQNAIKGTATPTHYRILESEFAAPLKDVAQMTHNLSYLFGRATRSTSVCAPVYYADLAADRARYYVRDVYNVHIPRDWEKPTFNEKETPFNIKVNNALKEQMFYI